MTTFKAWYHNHHYLNYYFFFWKKELQLGCMALLKTACHMPLISLKDMPSATTFDNNSQKNVEGGDGEGGGRGQKMWSKARMLPMMSSLGSGLVLVQITSVMKSN